MGAAAGAGIGTGLAFITGQQKKQMAAYENAVAESNAEMLIETSNRVLQRGQEQETNLKNQVNQMISTQRVSMASSGIDLSSGTAVAIQEETAAMGAEDASRIRNNAWLEAAGYRQQAINVRGQGRAAVLSAENEFKTGLITGGLQGYSTFKKG